MPVVLREAKIGLVVKPPKTAMYAGNGSLVRWDNLYEIVRKDPKNRSVWLNPHPVKMIVSGGKPVSATAGGWTITVDSATNGCLQIDEDSVWLLPTDPKPTDSVRLVNAADPSGDGEPKRRRGGPDTEYVFAFDDSEISLDDQPAQAQILADIFLEIYTSSGKNSWTEKEIDDILHLPENVEKLHTTQDPMTIFKFYRSRFQKKNFISRRD